MNTYTLYMDARAVGASEDDAAHEAHVATLTDEQYAEYYAARVAGMTARGAMRAAHVR